MSSDEVEDKDKGGRPPEGIKYGQHRNEFGWDPTGAKTMKGVMNSPETTFQPDTRMKRKVTKATAMENANIIKKMPTKKSKILKEESPNTDISSSMLDENNIL
jgi:hypothetical protein